VVTAEQAAFWTRNGYLWIPGFLTAAETAALLDWTAELAARPDTPGRWMRYYERPRGGERMLARVENFLPFHPGLDALFRAGRIPALLADLLGDAPVVFKDKINMKLPGGQPFTPHQDAPAYVDFDVDYHATVMLPVDVFTPENGCLEIAVEATQDTILPQNPDGSMRPDQVARFTYTPLLAVPGDLIVFDSYVPHHSGTNRSAGPRRSYYVTYNRAADGDHRAEYFARKRELFPPECEREPGVDYAARGAQFNLSNPFE
jgi:hypothetical protein